LVSIEPLFPAGLYYIAALIPVSLLLVPLEVVLQRFIVTRFPKLGQILFLPSPGFSKNSKELILALVGALPVGLLYSWVATWIEGVEVTVLGGGLHFIATYLTYFGGEALGKFAPRD
jgi:hypothetical protein